MTPETARLTINLDAVKANYRTLSTKASGARMSAVVKSDAYGLGAVRVALALSYEGCDLFFATRSAEGAALREAGVEGDIYILDGLVDGHAAHFHRHNMIPVLNCLAELAEWRNAAKARGETLRAAIHFDTGMNRLGFPAGELDTLAADPSLLHGIEVTFWMSHLASADEPDSHVNTMQLERFRAGLARLPEAKASFANSAGIYLGAEYHFDICRPGVALYGCTPGAHVNDPLAVVATTEARILQIQDLSPGESAGYGATWTASRPTRLGVLAIGYADGYPWALGNRSFVAVEGQRAPVVGRVSMDLITVDLTDVSADVARVGGWAQTMGEVITVTELGQAAGTLPYELLTSLGKRYTRRYV